MIKDTELRIGNWVTSDNKAIQISDIFDGGINRCNDNYECWPIYDLKNLEPIPLTPEILEACGFKNTYGNTDIFSKTTILLNEHPRTFHIINVPESGYKGYQLTIERYEKGVPMDIELEYLHQLQNLYFALTGEELTIKAFHTLSKL